MLALNTLLAWYAEGGEGITRVERVIHIDETSGVFTVCLLQERTDRAKTLAIAKRLDTPRRSRASLEAALSDGLAGITARIPSPISASRSKTSGGSATPGPSRTSSRRATAAGRSCARSSRRGGFVSSTAGRAGRSSSR